jgi:outer membrane protein assembly factor BamA
LKKDELFERSKVGGGLEALRNIYVKSGYLDFTAIPETEFGADQTIDLAITTEEGPQYRMDKLEIFATKEAGDKLREGWLLQEGTTFDASYIDTFLKRNATVLPPDFARQNVQLVRDCPNALVTVRFFIDPSRVPQSLHQNTTCEANPK